MNCHAFSVLELLLALCIIGALATLVMPKFGRTLQESREQLATAEMHAIRQAFMRFAADTGLPAKHPERLADIARYGLWPLLVADHPALTAGQDGFVAYEDYTAASGIGRQAPYLAAEDCVAIRSPDRASGQAASLDGTGHRVPVLRDPFGGYYRVICPAARTDSAGHSLDSAHRLRRLVLVCTGPDGVLSTLPTSFDLTDPQPATADDIIAVGDDTVLRLLPLE